MTLGQVGVFRPNGDPPERRPGRMVEPFSRELHRRILRRPKPRRAVLREEVRRLVMLVSHDLARPLTAIMNWRKLRSSVHGAICARPDAHAGNVCLITQE